MTYIGLGDTYTPGHKDACASIGQASMPMDHGVP